MIYSLKEFLENIIYESLHPELNKYLEERKLQSFNSMVESMS